MSRIWTVMVVSVLVSLYGCGSGSEKASATPEPAQATIPQVLQSRYATSPVELRFAQAVAVAAQSLATSAASPLQPAAAKAALLAYSDGVACAEKNSPTGDAASIKTDVLGLVFASKVERANLAALYATAGAFEIDMNRVGVAC